MGEEEDKEDEEVAELEPIAGFSLAKYEVAQAMEMAKHPTILESIQDEAYVEANRRFIRQERVATNALFPKLEAEDEAEADTEEPEELHEAELQLLPLYPELGMKTAHISHDNG
ncbi:putative LRR receptor-like serine/threonine-protein kinase [Hordeum vulgare]|nr:putative LRR receptor-like serine/threonine-protein kinase [Hordeum vulgare]